MINLGSMASYFGIEIVPGYGAAKAGVVQMTKTLAVAWAKHGIRVNAVAPGVVETAMTAPMMGFDELTAPLLARTPMGRFATPDDIAPVVLFLASPAARYITGQTLPVDGGFSMAGWIPAHGRVLARLGPGPPAEPGLSAHPLQGMSCRIMPSGSSTSSTYAPSASHVSRYAKRNDPN